MPTTIDIPNWLSESINEVCPYCGSPIVNNELLTDRYCSNKDCPEHIANKVVALAQWFGIKEWGIATARKAVVRYKLKFHTEMIPRWFDERPNLYLYEIGEIAMIKGHSKKWRNYCEGCKNVTEVIKKPWIPQDIKDNYLLLLYTSGVCKVKKVLTGSRINVMMSGSFNQYRARADFIRSMNDMYGDVIELVDVGKRKTDVQFLVKEAHATDHEKSAIASQCGVPIVTPKDLEESIKEYATYKREVITDEDTGVCG